MSLINKAAWDGLARQIPLTQQCSKGPEGALLSNEKSEEDKIAVIYDRGNTPPEITVKQTAGHVQTVMADGVAIAIVACAGGPPLTAQDVVLVERFVTAAQ
ncbi:MAG: hypothetical protein AB8B47_10310 [Roseobacter sp.]